MVHCHCNKCYYSLRVFIQIELHYPFENNHLPLAWSILGFLILELVDLNINYRTSIHSYMMSLQKFHASRVICYNQQLKIFCMIIMLSFSIFPTTTTTTNITKTYSHIRFQDVLMELLLFPALRFRWLPY